MVIYTLQTGENKKRKETCDRRERGKGGGGGGGGGV